MTLHKTVLCLNMYLSCCSDTLQAAKIYAVIHTSLLYRLHMASSLKVSRRWKCVICRVLHRSLQHRLHMASLLRLVGDGSVICRS